MILPFPSSPHCAPTRIVFAISIHTQAKNFPDASGSPRDESVRWRTRRSRDLPTNDKNGTSARKRFSSPGDFAKKNNQPPRRLRRKVNAHYFTPHPDSVVDRSFARVAIQHRLGLLS